MRLGIFGGTFDPVHFGHLLLAETCREQCRLDQVWFVPAAIAPHKRLGQPPADPSHRWTMLQLALAGQPSLQPSSLEVDRPGVSYTADTLELVRQLHPEAERFLLMGADSLHDLPQWRGPERICQLAMLVAVRRAGSPQPDFQPLERLVTAERLREFERQQVEMPQIQLSSTDIRRRVAKGRSIRFRTPRAVEAYIEAHGLYRDR